MEDNLIIDLYWERSEAAILETQKKYDRYCHSIAYNILFNDEDACECTNDTWMKAWTAIPPHRPNRLSTFLGKITRNLALDRYDAYTSKKRGGLTTELALNELCECIPSPDNASIADDLALRDALNHFLRELPSEPRKLFLRRYWYMSSIKEIADDFSLGESKVKMSLLRTRRQLKEFLEKEGIMI